MRGCRILAYFQAEYALLDVLPGERFPVFKLSPSSYISDHTRHKTCPPLVPLPSRIPTPRQRQTFGSLKRKPRAFAGIRGIGFRRTYRSHSMLPAWASGLAAYSRCWESRWRVPPFRVSTLRDLGPTYRRYALYAGFRWGGRS
jgi:hypothetical protein